MQNRVFSKKVDECLLFRQCRNKEFVGEGRGSVESAEQGIFKERRGAFAVQTVQKQDVLKEGKRALFRKSKQGVLEEVHDLLSERRCRTRGAFDAQQVLRKKVQNTRGV